MKFDRPWGNYFNALEEPGFKIKKILVKPSSRLSLQSHEHRSEHWVIVEGEAIVTVGEKETRMSKDQYVYIPKGSVHRLQNIGSEDLILVEVQLGPYLGEDDIKRYEDDYNRV
ncbi:MAG TPA: phosphomannose isomerase type II C-terminal cupin domain [Bacteriovoracaceae bacterium]|nr:phosphomannose isomerase type II C-terminal cupin domain [Bacteriovoracaceae bacterium]